MPQRHEEHKDARRRTALRTVSVKCNIATGGYHLKNESPTGGFSTSLNFDWNDQRVPDQILPLPTPTPSGNLL